MSNTDPRPRISTEALAGFAQVKPPSIRERLSRTGSYFGLVPERLPNGRLSWPADSFDRLREAGRTTHRPTPQRKPRNSEAAPGAGAA
jgi:hypothetical protein